MATLPTIPQPQSQPQILSQMLSSYASSTGISSPFVGSANLSFFQVASLAIARASGDVFTTILNSSLQYASTASLQAIAAEFGIIPTVSAVATGSVIVTDTTFQMVSTSVYPGAAPSNAGSVVIYAGSDTGFPSSGSIYIGRGTTQSEGPIAYSSITAIGNYFQFNLSTATQKFHNFNESIILSQGGNRTVPVNAIVIAPSNGLQANAQFSVTQTATILDGNTTVTNVPITATLPGSAGNVASSAINQFASPPFPNATVTNPISTSGGTDPETDDQLRTQIQNVLTSIGLGTTTAIENSLIGATSTTESATIASDNLVNNLDGTSTVYISTGGSTPYEAKTAGVAIEHIVDSAIGGEQFFQLATGGTQAPVAKAFLQSTDASPFAIYGGYVLAVTVGGVTTQHAFQTNDFQAPGAATAYEVCASINADTLVNFQATTAGDGTYVVIRSIAESHESIQVTVPSSASLVNANNYLGFPTTLNETLRLYENGVLLSEDGNTASVFTTQQSTWSAPGISNGATLIVSVDGTAQITYTILDTDFIATGLYTTVSSSNSLQSWAEVFNNKITGITATVSGSQIEIISNLGVSDRAQVSIDSSSTLVSSGKMFTPTPAGLTSTGLASQYTLDRNTAQFGLVTPLAAGDTLMAGTANTRGTITSAEISGATITFATEGYIWIAIDEVATLIPTGVTSGSSLTVSVSGSLVSYTSNTTSAFGNVSPGDYVIIWSEELDVTNRLEGRVHSITTTFVTDDTLNILVTGTEAAAVVPQTVVYRAGFVVANAAYSPQKFNVPAGAQTLDAIALYLQAQTDSLTFGVTTEEYLTIGTNTLNIAGQVTVITADAVGAQLNFSNGQSSGSSYPIIAYEDTVSNYMPSFFHSTVSADIYSLPPDSFITSFNSTISLAGREPDEIVTFINPYGSTLEVTTGTTVNLSNIITAIPSTTGFRINDSITGSGIPSGAVISSIDSSSQIHISLNATAGASGVTLTIIGVIDDEQPTGEVVQETTVAGNSVGITLDPDVRRIRENDRFFLSSPLSFGNNDSLVAIIDNNPVNNTFQVPLYRHALTNTTYGVNSNNFNAYDTDLAPTGSFSTSFGPTFSFANYKVLMQAKKTLSSTTAQSSILYRSTLWGSTGEQIVVSYIYSGSAIALNNSVIITDTINVSITIPPSTTATAIAAYVNANLSAYISATVVNDGSGGTPGTGIITANASTQLLDGVNWLLYSNIAANTVAGSGTTTTGSPVVTGVLPLVGIYKGASVSGTGITGGTTVTGINGNIITLSANVITGYTQTTLTFTNTGTPQFVLKNALALPTDVGYAFNNGEAIIFSPTTVDQVDQFINTQSVSGIITASVIDAVNRDSQLEISSDTYGSGGFIEIAGGSANGYSFPVLDSALNIDNQYCAISASSIASSNVLSGQWFSLEASNVQQKETQFGSNTDVTIVPNSPNAGLSTVSVSGQLFTQRYFGVPRTISGLNGLKFRVEFQGDLVCLSYVNSTSSPQYLTTPVNFASTTGDTFTVSLVADTNDAQYTITSGTTTFSNIPIGNLITIDIPSSTPNSGTFIVTGSSASVLQVTNTNAVTLGTTNITAGTTFVASTGVMEGDSVIIGAPFSDSNQGTYRVIRTFNDSFWIANNDAVEEEQTLTSSSFEFYEYEATIPEDSLVISGTSFGATNAGTYPITLVNSASSIVVSGVLSAASSVSLNGITASFYVDEGMPYTGYKRTYLVALQPGTTNLNEILFDTYLQYEKINQSAGVEVTALCKLGFPVQTSQGLDGYKYNTGLIQEANRIVYGDPTDPLTFPGVAAAGSDIFIQEPLALVVTLAIEVRLQTGAPFSSVSQQIQSNVSALINSNPVGQSIALGGIVAVVMTVPGVVSCAISSPLYSPTNDLIAVQPSEQTFVLDPSNISVSVIS